MLGVMPEREEEAAQQQPAAASEAGNGSGSMSDEPSGCGRARG
jgi:hypothetical protein